MNRKAHGHQRRHQKHDHQDHQSQHEGQKLSHQCDSESAGSCSAVSTFCASALGVLGGGAAKSSDSRPCRATRMKSIQIGSAAAAPVSLLPSVFFSSKPTQTPQVIEGEKPTNQASVKSLVVPVLPPSG